MAVKCLDSSESPQVMAELGQAAMERVNAEIATLQIMQTPLEFGRLYVSAMAGAYVQLLARMSGIEGEVIVNMATDASGVTVRAGRHVTQ